MRKTAIASFLVLAGTIHAGTWSRLPDIPRGQANMVSGDGPLVVAGNRAGGLAWWSSVQTAGILPTTWATLPVVASSGTGSGILGAPPSIVRGTLVASRTVDGLVYRHVGEATLRRAVVAVGLEPDVFDQDGRRILAVFAESTSIYGNALYLSVDSLASREKILDGSATVALHAWRRLAIPAEVRTISDCWIEGRILVLSTDSLGWISRDTGATWTKLAGLPDFSRLDILGDTIVAGSPALDKFYVSKDAGATWDSSALGSPQYVGFRGGMLFGVFRRAGAPYELARSETLGKTWNTLLAGVPVDNAADVVGWDGASIWTFRGLDLVRSPDKGKTWTVSDTALPEGRIAKVRAFGGTLLALQERQDQDLSLMPFARLWSLSGGIWTLVRDSVVDFETMETDTGWAVFALLDSATRWPGSPYQAHPILERSFDSKAWEKFPGVAPYSIVLGMCTQGLLVGEADGVAIVTPGSTVRRDTAWGASGKIRLDSYGGIAYQDGASVWVQVGTLQARRAGATTSLRERVASYVSLGSKYGFALGRLGPSTWMADLAPMGVPYETGRGNPAAGARLVRDSIAAWYGGNTIDLMRPEGRRVVTGPAGEGVSLVEWVSARSLGANATATDSVLVVADLHGRLWMQGAVGTGVAARASVGPSRFAAVHGGVALDLGRGGRVRIERFDAEGRSQGVVVDGSLEAGRHEFPVARVCAMTFAVATVDGIRVGSVAVPPAGR